LFVTLKRETLKNMRVFRFFLSECERVCSKCRTFSDLFLKSSWKEFAWAVVGLSACKEQKKNRGLIPPFRQKGELFGKVCKGF